METKNKEKIITIKTKKINKNNFKNLEKLLLGDLIKLLKKLKKEGSIDFCKRKLCSSIEEHIEKINDMKKYKEKMEKEKGFVSMEDFKRITMHPDNFF